MSVANFANEGGLLPVGNNNFEADGGLRPGCRRHSRRSGFRHDQQGFLEASNVDPVKEITNLITAQRAYEMNSKVVQAADQMEQTLTKNMG